MQRGSGKADPRSINRASSLLSVAMSNELLQKAKPANGAATDAAPREARQAGAGTSAGGGAGGGAGGPGGEGGERRRQLTPEQREKIEAMSPEERKAFFQKLRAEREARGEAAPAAGR